MVSPPRSRAQRLDALKVGRIVTMLVLSRKVGERIRIGDSVVVTIVRIGRGGVRVGIEAPNELSVVREELYQKASLAAAEVRASSGDRDDV